MVIYTTEISAEHANSCNYLLNHHFIVMSGRTTSIPSVNMAMAVSSDETAAFKRKLHRYLQMLEEYGGQKVYTPLGAISCDRHNLIISILRIVLVSRPQTTGPHHRKLPSQPNTLSNIPLHNYRRPMQQQQQSSRHLRSIYHRRSRYGASGSDVQTRTLLPVWREQELDYDVFETCSGWRAGSSCV